MKRIDIILCVETSVNTIQFYVFIFLFGYFSFHPPISVRNAFFKAKTAKCRSGRDILTLLTATKSDGARAQCNVIQI